MTEDTISSFSLSPQQRHVWLLSEEHPSQRLHTSGVIEIRGEVDEDRLRGALLGLRERFEILRTSFGVLPGTHTPVQSPREGSEVPFELEEQDLTELDADACERRFDELRARFEHADFDLESGAVFRALLVREAPDLRRLLIGFPSLCGDALSVDALAESLADELEGSGVAASDGDEEETMQYADVAQWLHELFESEEAEEGLAHWRRIDVSRSEPVQLPGERRAAAERSPSFESVTRAISAEQQRALNDLADARSVSVASVYAAAYAILLSRLTESSQLLLGLGVAGRGYEGLAQTPGHFWKTVPALFAVDPAQSLAELLGQVDSTLEECAEGQEYYDPERLGDSGRLDPSALVFCHLPAFEESAGGCTLSVQERRALADPFRLRLTAEELASDGGARLTLDFDAELLTPELVACMGDQLLCLLDSMASSPESAVGELSMLGQPERERILTQLSPGPEPHAPPGTVVDWISARAQRTPEAPAVASARGDLTYAELELASNRLARHLVAQGVSPGDFVGIHLDRSPELLVAILGAMKAGGAYVPLPHGYPAERLAFMAEDSGLAVVLTRSEIEAELPEGAARRIALDREASALEALDGGPVEGLARREGPAYVIYTSGSTGKPKGVVITHANLAHSTGARLVHYGEGVGCYLLLASVAFDSSVPGLFWTLVEGGKLLLPRDGFEEELASLPELIAEHGVTHMLGLPSLYGVILESAAPGQLASLDTVIVAGESCTTPLVEKHFESYPEARLFNEYGPTEGTVWGSVQDCSQGRGRYRVPIGRPIPGGATYVLGEGLEPRPIGVPGELFLGGHGVAAGYHGRPELTEERFLPDPFGVQPGAQRMYRTGDLVRFLPGGELEFLGRVDSQVKIRGYRIELEEIESALESHADVLEAVVAARTDAGGIGSLAAFVTSAAADEDALVAGVRAHLESALPDYMMPATISVLPELPRLPNGKVDRSRLPEEGGQELGARTPYVEPASPLERVLANVWAEVLGKERVGRDDDFFDLGGHSIVATRLYARIRDTLQVELPLRVLFDRSTVAELAQVILADEAQRERVERTAEMLERFSGLSDEELAARLDG